MDALTHKIPSVEGRDRVATCRLGFTELPFFQYQRCITGILHGYKLIIGCLIVLNDPM